MFPIINRGTWARVYAIRQIILRFLAQYAQEGSQSKINIVSLGAGYDSTYFWLKKNQPDIDSRIDYIEIDFTQVVKRKSTIIKDKPALRDLLIFNEAQNEALSANDIETSAYKLIESDVRDREIIISKLQAMNVDPSLPTLIITECLLIYMSAEDTQGVLNWSMDFFGSQGQIAYVNYEMINPDD